MSDQEEVNHDGNGNGAGGPNQPPNQSTTGGDDDPRRRLTVVEAERDEMKDRMLRIAADFENWKKRARKEQEDAEAKTRESVLKDVLDVMDNLERAVGAYGPAGQEAAAGSGAPVDGAAVLKGVSLVLRLFQSKLDRYGVKAIEAQGQPFDPRLHEAISKTATDAVPPGNVAVELQRGYRIGDRLLRPSMVSVATAAGGGGNENGGGGVVGDHRS